METIVDNIAIVYTLVYCVTAKNSLLSTPAFSDLLLLINFILIGCCIQCDMQSLTYLINILREHMYNKQYACIS